MYDLTKTLDTVAGSLEEGAWDPSGYHRRGFQYRLPGQTQWQEISQLKETPGGNTSKWHRVIVPSPSRETLYTALLLTDTEVHRMIRKVTNTTGDQRALFQNPKKDGEMATAGELARDLLSNFKWDDGLITSELEVKSRFSKLSHQFQIAAEPIPIFMTSITVLNVATRDSKGLLVTAGDFPMPHNPNHKGASQYVKSGEKVVNGQRAWGDLPTATGLMGMINPQVQDYEGVSEYVTDLNEWEPTLREVSFDNNKTKRAAKSGAVVRVGSEWYKITTHITPQQTWPDDARVEMTSIGKGRGVAGRYAAYGLEIADR